MIYDVRNKMKDKQIIVDPNDPTRIKEFSAQEDYEDLLKPIAKKGKLEYKSPELHEMREKCRSDISCLHPGIRRLLNPHQYPVGLEKSLHQHKNNKILEHRALKKEAKK